MPAQPIRLTSLSATWLRLMLRRGIVQFELPASFSAKNLEIETPRLGQIAAVRTPEAAETYFIGCQRAPLHLWNCVAVYWMPFWRRRSSVQTADVADIECDSGREEPRSPVRSSSQRSSDAGYAKTSTSGCYEDFGTRKEDRWGLFVLEDQEDDDADAVDIVALHGLNGHWEKTWQSTTTNSKGEHLVWLRDFLPQQIPHARVMSFGYDSVLLFSKSVSDIGTFAEQLLEALLSRRMGSAARRPIIFICHSLGGVVVKKALVRAHEKERYEPILQSTRGIVFFGTPHRGSSLATWSSMLSNIASAASFGSKTNWKLSKDLEHQSVALQEISKSFVDRAKNLQLITFYETDRMDYLNRRVVEEESAVLGFPNEVTIGIKGNHRTMCRFESIHEQRYRCVWTNLQNLADSASKPKLIPINQGSSVLSVRDETANSSKADDSTMSNGARGKSNRLAERYFEEIMSANSRREHDRTMALFGSDGLVVSKSNRALQAAVPSKMSKERTTEVSQASVTWEQRNQDEAVQARKKKAAREREEIEMQTMCYRLLRTSDYESHKYRYPTAVPGTCQWLLHHEKYRSWRQKQQSELLWLSADPGCGKSVLTSYLIDHLKDTENKVLVPEVVCYFFFKEDSNEQNNGIHAISAILHQLYTTQPWLLRHVTKPFADRADLLSNFKSLWELLDKSTTDPSSRDVILVFDGLDECEPVTRQQLLQSLARFYGSAGSNLTDPPFVKTIVASRPDNEIKVAFDVLPTIRLRGEDEPEAISQDVELVIDHHVESAIRRGLPDSILADVRAGLIRGADRTFLWTTLVIDLLAAKKGASKRELLDILQARGDIFRIYDRLLEHNSEPEQAIKLLHIVVGAVRPLTLAELSEAMAINSTHATFEDLELDVVHNFEERAKELCGNFIRVVRSTVYLVHQTAREFLLEQKTRTQPLGTGPRQADHPDKQSGGSWRHSIILQNAHSQLLDICVSYLGLLNVRSSVPPDLSYVLRSDLPATRFLDYAGRYWTKHYLELAPNLSNDQLAACAALCNASTAGFGNWFGKACESARNSGHRLREGSTRRDIAYLLGLDGVVELLDRILEPTVLESLPGDMVLSPENEHGNGVMAIPRSPRVQPNDDVIQPHTISPGGHWGHFPQPNLSQIMDSRANMHNPTFSRR